jgi:hypothetical protein
MTKNRLGNILGDFFTSSSGQPLQVHGPPKLTRGGLLIVLESIIVAAWKEDSDPMENHDEFDFWNPFDETVRAVIY